MSEESLLAKYLLRGMASGESLDVYYERARPGPDHPFVSTTTVPSVARGFAIDGQRENRGPHVVTVIDAAMARKLGARRALCAHAPDARERRKEGGAHMVFSIWNAREAQVHFDGMWPRGSRAALRAIAPVDWPGAAELRVPNVRIVRVEDLAQGLYATRRRRRAPWKRRLFQSTSPTADPS
ncbi:MAG: hypothetical protein OXU25_00550 [Thaumarchaeota archaeon]|nr:hypothetical protein [Nitrososphaerota archaeon]